MFFIMGIDKFTLFFPPTYISCLLICFVLFYIFMKSNIRKILLKFLVILVLHASVLSVMLLAAFKHQAAKEVTLPIYSFLILLQSDHFTLSWDHIPQMSCLLKDIFFLNFTKNASGIASQLKLLGTKDCSVSI